MLSTETDFFNLIKCGGSWCVVLFFFPTTEKCCYPWDIQTRRSLLMLIFLGFFFIKMKQNPKPFILLSEMTVSDVLKNKSRCYNPFLCLVDFIVFTEKNLLEYHWNQLLVLLHCIQPCGLFRIPEWIYSRIISSAQDVPHKTHVFEYSHLVEMRTINGWNSSRSRIPWWLLKQTFVL